MLSKYKIGELGRNKVDLDRKARRKWYDMKSSMRGQG